MESQKVTPVSDDPVSNIDTSLITILYVDDEKVNLRIFKLLMKKKFNVLVCDKAESALKVLDDNEVHIIISDQKMRGMNGTELLSLIHI